MNSPLTAEPALAAAPDCSNFSKFTAPASFAVTAAAWAVDGFTAKSAGAFWTTMTCGAVCAFVPVGVDLF